MIIEFYVILKVWDWILHNTLYSLFLGANRQTSFILMPYPIFKDSTGKELHFIGKDKAQLDDNKKVSDEVTHLKNAQSRRRSLPVPSRRWIIDWKNNG